MSEADDRAVNEKVQALSKAWDKWPIITSCTLLAVGALAVLGYNQYKLFELLKGLSCVGGGT